VKRRPANCQTTGSSKRRRPSIAYMLRVPDGRVCLSLVGQAVLRGAADGCPAGRRIINLSLLFSVHPRVFQFRSTDAETKSYENRFCRRSDRQPPPTGRRRRLLITPHVQSNLGAHALARHRASNTVLLFLTVTSCTSPPGDTRLITHTRTRQETDPRARESL
jgi:hypothetical protein